MRFPPPARIFAPLLVLIFGLAATWLDFELNLANDLERDLTTLRDRADATTLRLVNLAKESLNRNDMALLQSDLVTLADEPALEAAAITDRQGIILADSTGALRGKSIEQTPLAHVWQLAGSIDGDGPIQTEDDTHLYRWSSIPPDGNRVVLVYDRTQAIAEAEADAHGQLRWVAAAIALLCFALWAALHYGFAARVASLAQAVRDFDIEGNKPIKPLKGGDEVAELSGAFAAMAARIQAQESERVAMEREVLEAGERERRRIGHELHDGLGQRLTAASMATNSLADQIRETQPESANRATDIARNLRDAIAETRQLSHGLAPAGLGSGGLGDALAELVASFTGGPKVRAVFEGKRSTSISNSETEIHLFRIAQEAVTNALKHAAPGEIRVGLYEDNAALVLEIEDDGVGLPSPIPVGDGIGLRVMRHRAQLIGANIEMIPSAAGGTLVRCTLPSGPRP
jgi:signal transduction histidine kinase